MKKELRKSGIEIVDDVRWGTHFCQFYQAKKDLIDILVPYFKAGLENNEFCMWITSDTLKVEDAKSSLKKVVKNLDYYIKKGQIEILDYSEWYTKLGSFDADKVLESWVEKEKQAIKRGFDGLRFTGNTLWLDKRDWKKFTNYEAKVNSVIGKYKIIAICSYCLDKCGASDIIDVISNHKFALIKREGKWESIESAERKHIDEDLKKYKNIVESAQDAIFFKDLKSRYVIANAKTLELFGLSREEVIGKNDYELMQNQEEAKRNIEDDQHVFKTGKTREITKHMTDTDGKEYWFQAVKVPKFGNNGNIIGLIGIARDITELKKSEEVLRESEKRYRTLFNTVGSYTYTLSIENGKPTETINDLRCFGITGYTSEDYEADPFLWINMVHEEDKKLVREQAEKVLSGKSASPLEHRIIHKDGSIRWIRNILVPHYDEHGQIVYYDGVIEDITGRKKVEEEKLRLAEEFKRTVKGLKNQIFRYRKREDGEFVVTLSEGKIAEEFNSTTENIFGKTLTEVVGKENVDMYNSHYERVFAGETVEFEAKVGEQWFATTLSPFEKLSDGTVIEIIGEVTEITERKRMEQMLIQSEKMASIGTLAAGIAHEINNPMGYILSNLKILDKYNEQYQNFYINTKTWINKYSKQQSEELRNFINEFMKLKNNANIDYLLKDMKDAIEESIEGAEKIKKIVLDLRNFSRIHEPQIKPEDINRGIKNTINLIWNELRYKAEVITEFGDIPDIECDIDRLNQVFMNILINAAQAIEGCGIIKINTFSANNYVFVQISDTGKGIPKENITKIFDPFFTTKAPGEGTGLGLSISYKIIQEHNGTIDVESEVGKGTTFTLKLPVKKSD